MKSTLSSDVGKRIRELSPEKRALLEQRLQSSSNQDPGPVIGRRSPQDPRVLSFGQQQLWLVDQLSPGASAYNVPYPVRICGALNPEALHNAINSIVGRHEVLRTLFFNFKGQPLPAVAKNWCVEFRQVDLRDVPEDRRKVELTRLLREDAGRPFDLARDLKLRATLYRLDELEYVFLHVSHHISWDLRSKVIFYEELSPLYRRFSTGRSCELPEPALAYADYALWQRRYLQGEVLQRLTGYWQQQLAGAPPALDLPLDHPRPPVQTLRGAKYPVALSQDVLEYAQRLSRQSGVTLYMLMLASLNVLLFCYTEQEDICVGSPFDVRPKATEATIGMFINTLVLRTKLAGDLTFREVMARVKQATVGAIAHRDLPFEKIVEAVRPQRDLSRNALFQVNFRLRPGIAVGLNLDGMSTEPLELVDNHAAKFDLALELSSSAQSRGYFEYNTDLFDPITIARMAEQFCALLPALMSEPDRRLKELSAVQNINRDRSRPCF